MTKEVQRYVTALLIFLAFQPNGFCQRKSLFPPNVRRIVFLGNSITYNGRYVNALEGYIRLRYPKHSLEFINVGLSSETVSGLSEDGHAEGKFPRPDLQERLARVLALTKPDLVFACYGMNDGIYLPFDETRFGQFQTGVNWLHTEVMNAGASIIHLTPPIYDELRGGKTGYAAVLDRYSDWLLEQQKSRNWSVIDIHYPMKRLLDAHRSVDTDFAIASFALAEDGVHPGDAGHWLMAKTILLALGDTAVARAPDLKTAVDSVPNAPQLLKLISERQNLMRDAWLTATGHKRPGVKSGLPMEEAKAKVIEIEALIHSLIN